LTKTLIIPIRRRIRIGAAETRIGAAETGVPGATAAAEGLKNTNTNTDTRIVERIPIRSKKTRKTAPWLEIDPRGAAIASMLPPIELSLQATRK